ncbi:Uncharacterised protein [Mycobacteroides abscessus subsp. abscessus]|nr:Uncharacterised protein [Mycobacteroides abscessus subsp. abscessus]
MTIADGPVHQFDEPAQGAAAFQVCEQQRDTDDQRKDIARKCRVHRLGVQPRERKDGQRGAQCQHTDVHPPPDRGHQHDDQHDERKNLGGRH